MSSGKMASGRSLIECAHCGKLIGVAFTCPYCGSSRSLANDTRIEEKQEVSYRSETTDSSFSAFKGLFVVIGGILIIVGITCPPAGISMFSIVMLGALVSSFGKD
jgi:predicted RNA-binding Zn-ribbon protein involved in translation (DUF1610 family)